MCRVFRHGTYHLPLLLPPSNYKERDREKYRWEEKEYELSIESLSHSASYLIQLMKCVSPHLRRQLFLTLTHTHTLTNECTSTALSILKVPMPLVIHRVLNK